MSRVVVCGSLNMDLALTSVRRPAVGETLLGAQFALSPGGKGLNQAVAAARLGARTAMTGRVGRDPFGRALKAFLRLEGVDAKPVKTDPTAATGVALIQIAGGDNAITVASGANAYFRTADAAPRARAGDVWLAQAETPLATIARLFTEARRAGARTILNLAPFAPPPASLLLATEILVVNEIELAQASGRRVGAHDPVPRIARACAILRARGPEVVIATLGAQGAVLVDGAGTLVLPAPRARVVDTTGAGDCLCGALAARLAAGDSPRTALRYALAAASCSVERSGAAPSMPRPAAVAARLRKP